jgi:hypothetical protein
MVLGRSATLIAGTFIIEFGFFALAFEITRYLARNMSSNTAAAIAMTIVMLSTNSFRTAYADLFERAPVFDDILRARYLVISNARAKNPNSIIKVPAINVADRPSTINFMDIQDHWGAFPNPCYAEYFRIKGIETEK